MHAFYVSSGAPDTAVERSIQAGASADLRSVLDGDWSALAALVALPNASAPNKPRGVQLQRGQASAAVILA